jgi:hypothetical protein
MVRRCRLLDAQQGETQDEGCARPRGPMPSARPDWSGWWHHVAGEPERRDPGAWATTPGRKTYLRRQLWSRISHE